jgi:hypothetical protein
VGHHKAPILIRAIATAAPRYRIAHDESLVATIPAPVDGRQIGVERDLCPTSVFSVGFRRSGTT